MVDSINELSRRWDDFQGGRPITLPIGGTWWFYEPAAFNRSTPDGTVVPSFTFGENIDPTLDLMLAQRFAVILVKYGKAADEAERSCATLEAAWFLLARNYNVTQSEFETIVEAAIVWPEARQIALGKSLGSLVDSACSRSLARAEAA